MASDYTPGKGPKRDVGPAIDPSYFRPMPPVMLTRAPVAAPAPPVAAPPPRGVFSTMFPTAASNWVENQQRAGEADRKGESAKAVGAALAAMGGVPVGAAYDLLRERGPEREFGQGAVQFLQGLTNFGSGSGGPMPSDAVGPPLSPSEIAIVQAEGDRRRAAPTPAPKTWQDLQGDAFKAILSDPSGFSLNQLMALQKAAPASTEKALGPKDALLIKADRMADLYSTQKVAQIKAIKDPEERAAAQDAEDLERFRRAQALAGVSLQNQQLAEAIANGI